MFHVKHFWNNSKLDSDNDDVETDGEGERI